MIVGLYILAAALVIAISVAAFRAGQRAYTRRNWRKLRADYPTPPERPNCLHSPPLKISDVIDMATGYPAMGWQDLGYTKRKRWTALDALNSMGSEFDAMFPDERKSMFPYDMSNMLRGAARVLFAPAEEHHV